MEVGNAKLEMCDFSYRTYVINRNVCLNFLSCREFLTKHNNYLFKRLLKQNDLASSLVQFAENQL